jgi:arginyl-tRNA synthetase
MVDNTFLHFENPLKGIIAEAIKSLYSTEIAAESIVLQETKKEFDGDTTLVVFPFTKFSKKSPEETANDIGNFIKSSTFPLESFNVVKGFLNIEVSSSFWKNFLVQACADNKLLFSTASILQGKTPGYLMVEYSSPNTNKPLHLGHVRNNLLGFSVAQILKANGHKVLMVNLVNDRGIHICKSMLAWEKYGNGETPSSSGMKGDHLVGKYYVLFDKKYKEEVEVLLKKGHSKEVA